MKRAALRVAAARRKHHFRRSMHEGLEEVFARFAVGIGQAEGHHPIFRDADHEHARCGFGLHQDQRCLADAEIAQNTSCV